MLLLFLLFCFLLILLFTLRIVLSIFLHYCCCWYYCCNGCCTLYSDMNRILSDVILDSCVTVSLMPDKLLMENVLLVAILSSHIGIEVGKIRLSTAY